MVRLAGRAVVNPRLALDLLRTAWAFRRTYLRWRMYTAYADERAVPPPDDVVRFARWRRETMGL